MTGGTAGHCDWRLPSIAELRTILDVTQGNCGGGSGACIDPIFGPTAGAGSFWSATALAGTPAGTPPQVWFMRFFDGIVFNAGRHVNLYVRAVRTGL